VADRITRRVDKLELEMAHLRELFDSRFDAITRGQEAMLAKFDLLATQITETAGTVEATPAGRAMQQTVSGLRSETERRLSDLESKLNAHHTRFAGLQHNFDQLQGAYKFAKSTGVASLLLALASILVALLKEFAH
jgi:hypothetical protein